LNGSFPKLYVRFEVALMKSIFFGRALSTLGRVTLTLLDYLLGGEGEPFFKYANLISV